MPCAISTSGLVKTFGPTRALDGLDLEVPAGEVHGLFLGPNGAGKSTAIRVLLGLLRADAGSVDVPGRRPVARRRRAASPDRLRAGRRQPVAQPLRRRGDRPARRPARRRATRKRDALLERFDLDPAKKARTYSKGNRQKVALVAGLASDAELLLLDEPTSGLDPLKEAVFQQCIREVREEGRTVLLSSHILAEVEALCDRVSIIRLGRTVESGTLADLRHLTRTTITAELAAGHGALAAEAGVHNLAVSGERVSFDVDSEHLNAIVRRLGELGVRALTSHPPTLEQLFLRHYGDELEAEGLSADGA